MLERISTLNGPINHSGLQSSRIHHTLNLLVIQHLELHRESYNAILVDGILAALDLFFGSWPSIDPSFQSLTEIERRKNIYWCEPMMRGLLLAALGRKWDDVDRLLSWLDLDLQPEYLGPLEPEVGRLYILIASHFREPAIRGVETIVEEIHACKSKRPKLLLRIWESIQSKSQSDFDQAMLESLTLFAKTRFDPKSADFTEAIAIPQSFLNLLAIRSGLRHPILPDKLDARLITPETIGIR